MLNVSAEDYGKTLLSLVATTIDFFLALFINSLVEHHKDHKTFQSIAKSLQFEAQGNQTIFYESIEPNYKKQIVYRSF